MMQIYSAEFQSSAAKLSMVAYVLLWIGIYQEQNEFVSGSPSPSVGQTDVSR